MLERKIDYLPPGHRNRPGYPMEAKGLLFHTTNNWSDGAGDEMHAEYMENQRDRTVSWHLTVDKDSSTQHLPFSENGWHAGDGGEGFYNRNWIGMEIACEAVAPGEPLDKATYDNAVEEAARICKLFGFGWDQLQPHKVVYGKDCPHHTLFVHDQFKKDVFAKMIVNDIQKPTVPTATPGDGYIHVVKAGDTLTGIAELYKTSIHALVTLNQLENPNMIYVGQRLKLQGTVPPPPPKAPIVNAPVSQVAIVPYPGYPLKKGSTGKDVERVQRAVKVTADGKFGPVTEAAVKRYQSAHRLTVDGIVGRNTWNTMF